MTELEHATAALRFIRDRLAKLTPCLDEAVLNKNGHLYVDDHMWPSIINRGHRGWVAESLREAIVVLDLIEKSAAAGEGDE